MNLNNERPGRDRGLSQLRMKAHESRAKPQAPNPKRQGKPPNWKRCVRPGTPNCRRHKDRRLSSCWRSMRRDSKRFVPGPRSKRSFLIVPCSAPISGAVGRRPEISACAEKDKTRLMRQTASGLHCERDGNENQGSTDQAECHGARAGGVPFGVFQPMANTPHERDTP